MGCADSRENIAIPSLKHDCINLMLENLKILETLNYVALEKGNLCLALRIISLKKKTESYYSVVSQYRNFWIYLANNCSSASSENFISCIKEQVKEKKELVSTKKSLMQVVGTLKPSWESHFKTLDELKDYLETRKAVVSNSSSLYGSYYTEDFKSLKVAALEHSQSIHGFDSEIYKKIKHATVSKYKKPEDRVYYTTQIIHKTAPLSKLKFGSSKNFSKLEPVYSLKSFVANDSNSFIDSLFEKKDEPAVYTFADKKSDRSSYSGEYDYGNHFS